MWSRVGICIVGGRKVNSVFGFSIESLIGFSERVCAAAVVKSSIIIGAVIIVGELNLVWHILVHLLARLT